MKNRLLKWSVVDEEGTQECRLGMFALRANDEFWAVHTLRPDSNTHAQCSEFAHIVAHGQCDSIELGKLAAERALLRKGFGLEDLTDLLELVSPCYADRKGELHVSTHGRIVRASSIHPLGEATAHRWPERIVDGQYQPGLVSIYLTWPKEKKPGHDRLQVDVEDVVGSLMLESLLAAYSQPVGEQGEDE